MLRQERICQHAFMINARSGRQCQKSAAGTTSVGPASNPFNGKGTVMEHSMLSLHTVMELTMSMTWLASWKPSCLKPSARREMEVQLRVTHIHSQQTVPSVEQPKASWMPEQANQARFKASTSESRQTNRTHPRPKSCPPMPHRTTLMMQLACVKTLSLNPRLTTRTTNSMCQASKEVAVAQEAVV
jgi:hypothetical protein